MNQFEQVILANFIAKFKDCLIKLTVATSLFNKAFSIKESEKNILENLLQIPLRPARAISSAYIANITGQRCYILQRVSYLKNLKAKCNVV